MSPADFQTGGSAGDNSSRHPVVEAVMEVVFAKDNCAVRWNGGVVRLAKSQPWDATDPFVRANPALFGVEAHLVSRTVPYVESVEQATKAPGEKRATVRGR